MDKMSEKKEDVKDKNRTWWRWIFAVIVGFFIVYSTFWNFKLSFELLTTLALLLFFFIYDDVKEISIGSILSIKKEVEKVTRGQEKLFATINALAVNVNQRTEQNVNVQLPENLPVNKTEPKSEPIAKELLSDLINQNKEYYTILKQWEEYSKQQNQTVASLQKELEKAREIINRLFIDKEIAEFNYLNYFFVYNTKCLLLWLVKKGSASGLEIAPQANSIGIMRDNIKVTIDVLQFNNMISIANDTYSATPRGRLFLDHIGFKEPVLYPGGIAGRLSSAMPEARRDWKGIAG